MSLDAATLAAIARELAPLAGARVGSVRMHAPRALTLELLGRARATLLVSAEPDVTRLHAVERRPASRPDPVPFQAVLRRALEGATLVSLSSLEGDRVVELAFERGGRGVRLVAELTGRHGNLFLVGADGILQAAAERSASRTRPLLPGKPYVPPERREERPAVWRPVAAGAGPFPLSAAVEERYRALEAERDASEGRRRLREPLRAAAARAEKALGKLAEEAARIPRAEEDRRRADLLKQNLHAVPRGAREVTLTEWTESGAQPVRVELDPALTPRENMEARYRRYRRIVESADRVRARDAEVRDRLAQLRALLAQVEGAAPDALPALERAARRVGAAPRPPPRPRSRRDEPLPPYRTFRSATGVALLVGRNAEANDALTVRVARGNDLWFHARGRGGAHVVARLEKGKPPDGETLLDAAHLAAHFSDARAAPEVEVVATRARFVRKPKGSPAGAVTYSQERSIQVRVERPRIERLLASEES
jgi:predicted ribosome quality control (RQC) complex YloA/Tae2 family protein